MLCLLNLLNWTIFWFRPGGDLDADELGNLLASIFLEGASQFSTLGQAVAANPWPMALWGLIVAGALALGSAPALFGLILVMPVLGHATWHLYRKLVADA